MQNLFNANNLYPAMQGNTQHSGAQMQEFSYSANKAILASVASSGESVRSTQAFFHSELVSLSVENSGHRIFAQAINSSMSIEQSTSSVEPYQAIVPFQPPSPAEVAKNVLGFVEARIQSEANSGASQERLDSLLDQARTGVEKGFALARNDIESLGLMNEELSDEIDQSFDLINTGLDSLSSRFSKGETEEELVDGVTEKAPSETSVSKADKQFDGAATIVSAESRLINLSGQSSSPEDSKRVAGINLDAASYRQMGSEFSLKTRDGDIVSISFAQISESYYQAGSGTGTERYFYESRQHQGYQVSVQGHLDEGEVAAINDLLSQVNDISQLFYSGDFQQAFSSALEIGFDASEIAAFSLDLSDVQVEEVRVYGDSNPGQRGSVLERNQPLIEMVNRLGQGVALLAQFESRQSDFQELVLEFIAREASANEIVRPDSGQYFSEFTAAIIESLSSKVLE